MTDLPVSRLDEILAPQPWTEQDREKLYATARMEAITSWMQRHPERHFGPDLAAEWLSNPELDDTVTIGAHELLEFTLDTLDAAIRGINAVLCPNRN